ncbi:MAG: hypothetical protein AAB493_02470 [Patescibacteria group bacterium]
MKKDEDDKKIKKSVADEIGGLRVISASEMEKLGTTYLQPNVVPLSVGVQPSGLEIKASALKNYNLASAVYTENGLNFDRFGAVVSQPQSNILSGLNRVNLGRSVYGDIEQPTREEIEELIKKETSSLKRDTMTPEQVLALIEKSNTERQKVQEETISMVEKQSFEIIKKMFLEGKTFAWRCKCGEILDEFKAEEDIKRIKSYLEDFRKGKLKICQKKGYRNWFELRGGEIVCSESALLDKEFRKPKETGQKLDNQ